MVSKSYVYAPKYKSVPSIYNISLPSVFRWGFPLTLWGAAAGTGVLFFVDSIPLLRRMIYEKLPVVGPYYDDSVDPMDTPF